MGRAQPFADFLFGKKYAVKDGDFCARLFSRNSFEAADRRDYELEKAGFLPVTGKSRFCGWG